MKIGIPIDKQDINSKVGSTFARSTYFLIYDDETKESIYLDNTAAASQGGAGIKAAQILVDNKIDLLLTPRCGENAAEIIQAANIKMYKTFEASAKENIDAFLAGKLEVLNEIHPGHHGGDH